MKNSPATASMQDVLTSVVDAVGFSIKDREKALADLWQAVAVKLLLVCEEKSLCPKLLGDLRRAMSDGNTARFRQLFADLLADPEVAAIFTPVLQEILRGWVAAIGSGLTDEQAEEAARKLSAVAQTIQGDT